MKTLINELYKKGSLWFYLVSAISSDSLMSVEDCDNAMRLLERTIDAVPDTDLSDEDKEKTVEYCMRGIEICRADREMFEKMDRKQNNIK